MKRAYGRSIPAPLPAHRMLSRVAAVPSVMDLRSSCGPIKDQGQLGSCTGHAFSSGMEWIFRRYLARQPILSPLYLYAKELIADGNFPNDDGSDGVTGCNVTIASGCCEDALYPDASQEILEPTPAQDANAALYRLGAYHGLTSSEVALSVLGDPTPWPVEMGFSVMSDFESDEVAETGIYLAKGTPLGEGHEIAPTGGYDVGQTPVFRPASCPPAVLFQNSWGDWGFDHGFVWVVLSVLDDPQTDLKIVHSGGPWK